MLQDHITARLRLARAETRDDGVAYLSKALRALSTYTSGLDRDRAAALAAQPDTASRHQMLKAAILDKLFLVCISVIFAFGSRFHHNIRRQAQTRPPMTAFLRNWPLWFLAVAREPLFLPLPCQPHMQLSTTQSRAQKSPRPRSRRQARIRAQVGDAFDVVCGS